MAYCFAGLVNMSISATLAAGVLLLFRLFFQKRLPAAFCYLLWGVVLFRLCVPFSLPLFPLPFPGRDAGGGFLVTVDYLGQGGSPLTVSGASGNEGLLLSAASIIWIFGMILLFLWGLAGRWAFGWRLRAALPIPELLPLLETCRVRTGVRQRVQLRTLPVDSPMAYGLRPRICLPRACLQESSGALTHILLHELIHIRRGDAALKTLFLAVCAVHWFNPAVWLCFFLLQRDLERSCDEAVLDILGEDEKADYAETLLRFSARQHHSFGAAYLAFGESALKTRIGTIIRYKRLSRGKLVLYSFLVTLLGLLIAVNPVSAPRRYSFVSRPVSSEAAGDYDACCRALSDALNSRDANRLLEMSVDSDPQFLPLYEWVSGAPLTVEQWALYPQTEGEAFCALEAAGPAGERLRLVAGLTRGDGGAMVKTLEAQSVFDGKMTAAGCPQADLVRNLHRFGLTGELDRPPAPSVAAFCVNEEYHDRVKDGTIPPDTTLLPAEWISAAARTYFGIADFSYTMDPTLYDAATDCYRYDPSRGVETPVEITEVRRGRQTLVTARFFLDPLHTVEEKTAVYTIVKKENAS